MLKVCIQANAEFNCCFHFDHQYFYCMCGYIYWFVTIYTFETETFENSMSCAQKGGTGQNKRKLSINWFLKKKLKGVWKSHFDHIWVVSISHCSVVVKKKSDVHGIIKTQNNLGRYHIVTPLFEYFYFLVEIFIQSCWHEIVNSTDRVNWPLFFVAMPGGRSHICNQQMSPLSTFSDQV